MVSAANSRFNPRINSRSSKPMHFQRKKIKKKRIKKKINLKFGHIFLAFLLLVGIFYSLQQCFLFLICWDYLDIKEIKITCTRKEVKREIEHLLKGKKLGNILLADISQLQQKLKAHRLVEEAQIKKIFPASLRIDIREREPVAVLKKENLYLIDKNGNQLEKIYSTKNLNFPLIIDSNNFQHNYEEKLKLVWECLKTLSPSEKERIRAFEFDYYRWITLHLKDTETKIIIDSNEFAQRLKYFYEHYNDLEARFGPIGYVDLRFHDRLYIKPQKNPNKSIIPNPKKEAL